MASTMTLRTSPGIAGLVPILALLVAWAVPRPASAQGSPPPRETYGQRLVDHMVAAYPDLSNVELALQSGPSCATVAATERASDVGEKCDADEYGPIRTGKPNVEKPSSQDPVYDITQALHDGSGHLIGAVGMDIAPPERGGEAAAVARARHLLGELESQISSAAALQRTVSSGITKDSAAAVARSRVPNSTIQSGEFEREKGHWVYSFDLKVPGRSGIDEVLVDADDGHVVSLAHESPAEEGGEAAAESDSSGGPTKPGRRPGPAVT